MYNSFAKSSPNHVHDRTLIVPKNMNLFEKKYILLPINLEKHWSLIVVVNANLITYETAETKDKTQSCLLHMDSCGDYHDSNTISDHILKWLNREYAFWNHKNDEDIVDIFNKNSLPILKLNGKFVFLDYF